MKKIVKDLIFNKKSYFSRKDKKKYKTNTKIYDFKVFLISPKISQYILLIYFLFVNKLFKIIFMHNPIFCLRNIKIIQIVELCNVNKQIYTIKLCQCN